MCESGALLCRMFFDMVSHVFRWGICMKNWEGGFYRYKNTEMTKITELDFIMYRPTILLCRAPRCASLHVVNHRHVLFEGLPVASDAFGSFEGEIQMYIRS